MRMMKNALTGGLLFLAIGSSASTQAQEGVPLGDIRGTVELIPGVRAPGCLVSVVGSPRGATCNANGEYLIRAIDPANFYQITAGLVEPDTFELLVAPHPIYIGVHSGATTTAPPIVLNRPLPVSGRVGGISALNCGAYFVTVADQKVAASLCPSGTFVLNGLPPGRHLLEVDKFVPPFTPGLGSVTAVDIYVTNDMQFVTNLKVSLGLPALLPLRPPAGD